MYDSFAQWRNEIRAAQKAHRLMKEALKATEGLQLGGWYRGNLASAISEIETVIKKQDEFLRMEKEMCA